MISSKYFRVPKKKEVLQENEINVTSRQDPISFIRYAIFLFEKRNLPYVRFKASGSAISSLVNISEILKKVIPSIHQDNRIYTLKYEQDYEPKEKGLDHVKIVRNVPILEITFYKTILDSELVNHYGYQPAISSEIFERVKINIVNLIRKQPQYNNVQNRQFSIRGRSGYIPGFRGGRRGHGLRGGGGTISRGTDRYVQRFGGVFRGRSSNSHMRNESNKNEDNTGYTGYSDYNNDNTKNERPIRGGFRAFGRYRSKFDPVNR